MSVIVVTWSIGLNGIVGICANRACKPAQRCDDGLRGLGEPAAAQARGRRAFAERLQRAQLVGVPRADLALTVCAVGIGAWCDEEDEVRPKACDGRLERPGVRVLDDCDCARAPRFKVRVELPRGASRRPARAR